MAPYNYSGQNAGSGGRSPAFSEELDGEPRPLMPRLTPEQRLAMIKYRKPRRGLSNPVGKLWNLPNTLLGLGYGLTGHLVGELMGKDPKMSFGEDGIEFTDNPFGGVGAITLGNASIYNVDPNFIQDGATIREHEKQHKLQGELLGPLYLPSNVLGGLLALALDRDQGRPNWHGKHNWNESGPQMTPPRPWPPRR